MADIDQELKDFENSRGLSDQFWNFDEGLKKETDEILRGLNKVEFLQKKKEALAALKQDYHKLEALKRDLEGFTPEYLETTQELHALLRELDDSKRLPSIEELHQYQETAFEIEYALDEIELLLLSDLEAAEKEDLRKTRKMLITKQLDLLELVKLAQQVYIEDQVCSYKEPPRPESPIESEY